MHAIEVDQLEKRYGTIQALAGVSFTVGQGEFFGLLGPNGAGKTTLLNILAGLTRPTGGSAKVCGHDVVSSFRTARRNLGVVPQELVIESFFTLQHVLRLQAGYFGITDAAEWADELLRRLHLWEHRGKTGRQLSGGMKRRLLVAKALVHRPPVIVLDEPTAGVDVELRREIWDFIREIHRAGTTILLTTHYLAEAEENCDRIGILGHGKLLSLERTEDLLRTRFDRQVIVKASMPLETVPEALQPFEVEISDGGRLLRVKTHGADERRRLFEALRDVAIEDVDVVRPNLEDVFLDLTSSSRREGTGAGS